MVRELGLHHRRGCLEVRAQQVIRHAVACKVPCTSQAAVRHALLNSNIRKAQSTEDNLQ